MGWIRCSGSGGVVGDGRWGDWALRGPENLRSARGLAIVSEHFGALGMTMRSARGAIWSARGALRTR